MADLDHHLPGIVAGDADAFGRWVAGAELQVRDSLRPFAASVDAEAVYVHPAFALTPVAANKSFISMEGLYLLGFGPRTAAAARDLSVKLYPALAPQAEKFASRAGTANCRL